MSLQSAFRTALLDPESAVPEGVQNPDGRPATKRFNVYRNNVAVSLTEALEAAFPVVRALVGDAFFKAMAGVYLRAHPPSSPLMMFYGETMPDFLTGFAPARSVPYLPDMARLELALRQSYHAADTVPLTPEALSRIAPDDLPRLILSFAPTVRLVSSRYPLCSLWRANTTGGKPSRMAEPALVTRPEFDPVVDVLSLPQADVLRALMAGETLGSALSHGGEGFDAGALIGLLVQRSALISLNT